MGWVGSGTKLPLWVGWFGISLITRLSPFSLAEVGATAELVAENELVTDQPSLYYHILSDIRTPSPVFPTLL